MKLNRTQTVTILSLAVLIFGFTLFQASWLAAKPIGKPKLVADSSIDPVRDTAGCIANANAGYGTVAVGPDVGALQAAVGAGADGIRIGAQVIEGRAVVARQFQSECAADIAQPRADVAKAATAITKPKLFWDLKGAESATLLLAQLPPEALERSVFMGDAAAVAAIRKTRPEAWAFSTSGARKCASDYRVSGLWGSVPASCKNGTILLTLDDLGYSLWGWPNAFLARLEAADASVIIADDVVAGRIKGLSKVDQYGEIANSYNGYIWVDNIADLGPALKR